MNLFSLNSEYFLLKEEKHSKTLYCIYRRAWSGFDILIENEKYSNKDVAETRLVELNSSRRRIHYPNNHMC